MDEDPQVTINMKVLRWKRIWLRAKQVRFLIALGGHLLQYPIPSLLSSLYLLSFPFFFFTLSPFLFFGTPSRSRPRSMLVNSIYISTCSPSFDDAFVALAGVVAVALQSSSSTF